VIWLEGDGDSIFLQRDEVFPFASKASWVIQGVGKRRNEESLSLFNILKYKSKIFFPSLANLIFLFLFLSLSLSRGGFLLSDADTGWHIRAGEFILATFSVPKHDIFSFITPPPHWINHQWLSEVIMAFVHQSWGLTGIVIFFSLLISLSYSILFKLMQNERGNIFLVVFMILLTIASSIFHWLARPHIFSLLLFVTSYYLLERFQSGHIRALYFFPPLILFWVNLHGGFISGLILMLIYLVGNLVKFVLSRDENRGLCRQKTKALTLTLSACLFVSLVNPYGLDAVLYPMKLISQKLIMDRMAEFQSPNFHHLLLLPSKYFLLLMILVIGISKKNLSVIEILLIMVFVNMALFSQRFIPLFCIVAAPILIKNTQWIFNQTKNRFVDIFQKKSKDISLMDASGSGYLWLVVGILIVTLALATNRIEYKFDETRKPVEAVNFLKKVSLKGNMFNDDEFGDYIIYSVHPQYKVFIDSRVDMYGEDHFKDYLTMLYLKPGWENIIEKYNINWMILDSDSIFSRHLMGRNDWKLIYSDKVANIFVRNTSQNQDVPQPKGH
jgi:hypothetical protein